MDKNLFQLRFYTGFTGFLTILTGIRILWDFGTVALTALAYAEITIGIFLLGFALFLRFLLTKASSILIGSMILSIVLHAVIATTGLIEHMFRKSMIGILVILVFAYAYLIQRILRTRKPTSLKEG